MYDPGHQATIDAVQSRLQQRLGERCEWIRIEEADCFLWMGVGIKTHGDIQHGVRGYWADAEDDPVLFADLVADKLIKWLDTHGL